MNNNLLSYKKKRIDYNNNWPDDIIEFSGQQDFLKLLNEKKVNTILKPIQLPLILDFHFQRLLSFKIDIYEQLPNRPDIAFDLAWRTFEAYSAYFSHKGNWNTTKTWKILNKVCEDILNIQINKNTKLSDALSQLFNSVPLQATEFLVKRLFEKTTASIKSQQAQIIERAKDSLGQDFLDSVESKYGEITSENQRKIGMLLQMLISGKQVDIKGSFYKLDKLKTLKLIINGILYTYRNERFHGDSFSPFKSSKTQIKTYAHSYYCLIATYFFLSQLIYQHFPEEFNLEDIIQTLEENTHRYNLVFNAYKKK